MAVYEDPDRALARWLQERDERFLRLEREDRIADYTPAECVSPSRGTASPGEGEGPRVTSAMVTLAYTVLNGSWLDARQASRVLAELVLEAGE